MLVGLGLAYLPEDQVQRHIGEGRLTRVLADWCALFSGYQLYYPSRRQPAPAFAVLVEALRHREQPSDPSDGTNRVPGTWFKNRNPAIGRNTT